MPNARKDPRYADGSGSDEVTYRIKLPAGVDRNAARGARRRSTTRRFRRTSCKSLFETAPDGPATQRLHYICSNIDLRGTPIEDWKLPVAVGHGG